MNPVRAKKHLGQHFLCEKAVAEKIVRSLNLPEENPVLEIGPGTGALTRFLIRRSGMYLGIEKDLSLAKALAEAHPHAAFAAMDALNFAWGKIHVWPQAGIIGNLPYNVASPIIWDMTAQARGYACAVFMVQKEVAQRIASPPTGKIYGALSAWVQSFVHVESLFTVKPQCFKPRPKVDSAVVRLTPLSMPYAGDITSLAAFLRYIFGQRRKQMGTILRTRWTQELDTWFVQHRISPTIRPERLTPIQLQEIFALLSPALDGKNEKQNNKNTVSSGKNPNKCGLCS